VLALVIAAGCATSAPAPAASPAESGSPAPSVDARAALEAALDRLAAGYAFESTLTVGDELATRATGVWVDGTSQIEVESGSATVTYLSVPPRAWVREEGAEEWVELEGEIPATPPLDMLGEPADVRVGAAAVGSTELLGTYPAAALGLASDVPVDVRFVMSGDGTVEAGYEARIAGADAVVHTTMTPQPNVEPFEPPASDG
jgi:hypothetical protein